MVQWLYDNLGNHIYNTSTMWICSIIFLLLYPVISAYRDHLEFPETRVVAIIFGQPITETKIWHYLGFITRVGTAIVVIQDVWLIFAYGFYFWIIFELAINKFLGNRAFYLDKSTSTGKFIRFIGLGGFEAFLVKLAYLIVILTIRFI